jgi:steroid 5-alpha reductase family enzyme
MRVAYPDGTVIGTGDASSPTLTVHDFFETVGDHQLRVFKADPSHRGLLMDRGLWAWTRHRSARS